MKTQSVISMLALTLAWIGDSPVLAQGKLPPGFDAPPQIDYPPRSETPPSPAPPMRFEAPPRDDFAEPRGVTTQSAQKIPVARDIKNPFSDPVPAVTDDAVTPTSHSMPAAVSTTATLSIRPCVEIQQIMPKTVHPGQQVPIQIVAANTGNVAVERVIVTNQLGEGVKLVDATPKAELNSDTLIWSFGKMEPGQEKLIELTVSLRPDAQVDSLDNVATVRYEAHSKQSARIRTPKVTIAVKGPETGIVGQPMTFDIVLTNEGDAPARNVVLRAPLPKGLEHPYGPDLENDVGDLSAGDQREIRLTVTPNTAGKLTSKLTITAADVPPVEREVTVEIDRIELEVAASGPKVRYLNRPCTYEFTVSNTGTTLAQRAELVATLPEGVTFAHASHGGRHDSSYRTITWAIGDLKPGDKKSVGVTGIAMKIGEQICNAVMSAQGIGDQETQWTTAVKGIPALLVEVLDVDDPIEVGAETVYEIRVVNQGTSPATNVRIVADVPPELEPIATDGPTVQDPDQKQGQLAFQPLKSLAPKAAVTYRIKLKGIAKGRSRFTTSVLTDQFEDPIREEESTTVYADE